MSLEWLPSLSCWGSRPFKKRPSHLLTSGQQMFISLSSGGNSTADVSKLVTFQLTHFLWRLLTCFAKS